jgi:WD repeat-containing protein 35
VPTEQLIFLGDASNRNKINLIIANEITPHLTAEEYMDKGEYENELRQVIGDTKAAYDIRCAPWPASLPAMWPTC